MIDAMSKISSLFLGMWSFGKVFVNFFNYRVFNNELISKLITFEEGMFDEKDRKVDDETPLDDFTDIPRRWMRLETNFVPNAG